MVAVGWGPFKMKLSCPLVVAELICSLGVAHVLGRLGPGISPALQLNSNLATASHRTSEAAACVVARDRFDCTTRTYIDKLTGGTAMPQRAEAEY